MSENVKQAYVMFNGQKFVANYDESGGEWVAVLTAPNQSSWDEPNHMFDLTLHAEDLAGNTVSMDSTDETYGSLLQVRVLEKTPPNAWFVSPTQDAVLGDNSVSVELRISDTGGSGLNYSSVVFKVNGTVVDGFDVESAWKNVQGDMVASYVAENLSDGINTLELSVQDNDGNSSGKTELSFVISTQGPLLEIYTPVDNLITNSRVVTVSGKATPSSEYTELGYVEVNGNRVTDISDDGTFNFDVELDVGESEVRIDVVDSLGKKTTIIRKVTVDTTAPIITDVVVEPRVVDAGGVIRVTFKVVDS